MKTGKGREERRRLEGGNEERCGEEAKGGIGRVDFGVACEEVESRRDG